jgi:methionyl-tRNA formyltransferase
MTKVVFFGSPDFAANTLEFLLENQIDIVAIVTKPDKAKGRSGKLLPPSVKERAQRLAPKIPIYQPVKASDPTFVETLQTYDADLFVVVAYGEILRQAVLDIPKKACINVHASLLPAYRGAAPIQRAILNGERESGVTIMHMVRKMDAGDMIKTVTCPIGPNTNAKELEEALNDAGKRALLEVIESGNFDGTVQDESKVTIAPKITPEDLPIDWEKSASEIHNQIRAFGPKPGAFSWVSINGNSKRLKILSSFPVDRTGEPGNILAYGKQEFIVACGKGALSLVTVQLEGKKMTPSESFMRGIPVQEITFLKKT